MGLTDKKRRDMPRGAARRRTRCERSFTVKTERVKWA